MDISRRQPGLKTKPVTKVKRNMFRRTTKIVLGGPTKAKRKNFGKKNNNGKNTNRRNRRSK